MTLWEEDEKLILLLLFVFTTKNWVTKVIRYLFTYGMSFLHPENPKSPVTNNTFRHTHPKINSTNKDKIREYMVWWGNIYSASIQLFTLLIISTTSIVLHFVLCGFQVAGAPCRKISDLNSTLLNIMSHVIPKYVYSISFWPM